MRNQRRARALQHIVARVCIIPDTYIKYSGYVEGLHHQTCADWHSV
jgi:hypothetical protein